MSRGRGYGGRGSGRGGSYRGSSSAYRGSSSRNSGFGSSSYGGGGSSRGPYGSSYNSSRSRDRLGSRHDRRDDHKRSYRASSRDRSPDRKRSRHEDSRLSSSYSSYRRTDSSRSRQTPPPPSVRPTSSSTYRAHRDGSSHRHSGGGTDTMGPPKSAPSRSRTTRTRVAGSAAGEGSSGRFRGSSSRGLRPVRRRESSDMRLMRMQLLLARKKDRARRIKIARLTSSLRRRKDVPRKPLRKVRTDKKDESKTDDEEEKKKAKNGDGDEENETEEGKEGEETENKDGAAAAKEGKEEKEGDGETADGEAEPKEGDEKETDEDRAKKALAKGRKKRSFIKLTCVHCRMKCLTFKEYSSHLFSRTHNQAMRRLALRQKAQLSHMRMQQRNAQREIEEKSKEETEDSKPQFCLLCRLNYRQPKSKHQLSESHRNMKKFLMPYCSVCHIAFKSPMLYETHRCSLEHIIRKNRSKESQTSDRSDNEKEVDLNNFMTVDSVGEIDGHSLLADGEIEAEGEDVNVGADHVKKTEAFFCDLCRLYFPFKDDEETVLKRHCSSRGHLKAFLRFKEDQTLRLEAERVQRRQKDGKEKQKEDGDDKDKDEEGNENENENADPNEPEDKLWEDVDKDLGDLLREVGRDENEDEEEDGSVLNINIRRFDRFKNSDKQKEEVNGMDKDDSSEKANDDEPKETTPAKPAKKEAEAKTAAAKKEKEKEKEKEEEAVEA